MAQIWQRARGLAPRVLVVVSALTALGGCFLVEPNELDVKLIGVTNGDVVTPKSSLQYEVTVSGYSTSDVEIEFIIEGAETTREKVRTLKGTWQVDGTFLEKAGKSRIFLRATARSSLNEEPEVVESASVFVEVNPRLKGIVLVSPKAGGSIALGTPVQFRVSGTDLWSSIRIHAVEDDGTKADWHVIAGPGKKSSAQHSWVVEGGVKKSIGKHRVRLVASYGDRKVQTDPFEIEVAYLLDDIELLVRSPSGDLAKAGTSDLELRKVDELVVRVSGKGLSGRTLEIFGPLDSKAKLGTAVATADEVDFVHKPKWEDFAKGKRKQSYHFKVTTGLFEQSTGASILRWGIDSCQWRLANGTVLTNNKKVASGTEVHLVVSAWGYKSSTANVVIKEEDSGFDDDLIKTMQTPATTDTIDVTWKATYVDDSKYVPLVGWVKTDPEFYYTVTIEDLKCKSTLIEVD